MESPSDTLKRAGALRGSREHAAYGATVELSGRKIPETSPHVEPPLTVARRDFLQVPALARLLRGSRSSLSNQLPTDPAKENP